MASSAKIIMQCQTARNLTNLPNTQIRGEFCIVTVLARSCTIGLQDGKGGRLEPR